MRHVNALECIDFYKADHRRQYPEGTELVVSNFTPRSGRNANITDKSGIIFFGLQYFIIDFLIDRFNSSFFSLPIETAVGEYKQLMDESLGKDSIPLDHIERLYLLGYLPIEIRAVAEGTRVPVGVPALVLYNTLPEFFWLVNYLETVLSAYLWMPCTSATTANHYRKLVNYYTQLTGSPEWFPDWQCHDFSFRGQSSLESAIVSGAAHLTSFTGTDSVPSIRFLKKYYGATTEHGPIGGSVPATEHSVMCMGSEKGEKETFEHLLKLYPKGIVSIVSDTWDLWNVVTNILPALKDQIMARDGKLVIRPDSGDPVDIICGEPQDMNPHHEDWAHWAMKSVAEQKGVVGALWDLFGGTVTSTGHKLLDSHIGVIYGDSITPERAERILTKLEAKGFASANIVFGVGSYTYQYVTRDTWGWAVKATFGRVNGEDRKIFKKPKTDSGEKNSARGLLVVRKEKGGLKLEQDAIWSDFISDENELKPVFRDGQLLVQQNLQDIRKKIKQQG